MTAEIKNGFLTVTVPLNPQPFPRSGSGKTLVVASTHGNLPSTVTVRVGRGGQVLPVVIGLNAFVKAPSDE